MLGGYFVPLAPWLLPAAEARARERTARAGRRRLPAHASALGHGAAATGGAASILDTVDSGALPVPNRARNEMASL